LEHVGEKQQKIAERHQTATWKLSEIGTKGRQKSTEKVFVGKVVQKIENSD